MKNNQTPAEKMNVDHLPKSDPWRRIIDGPNFMAFPAKPLSDPTATFHDAYVARLESLVDKGGWVPHQEVDAFLRAQVMRMSVMLTSDGDGDLLVLGETTEQAVVENANEVVDWALVTLKRQGSFESMSNDDARIFLYELIDRVKARCGLRSTDPALATADKKILWPGVDDIIEHAGEQATGNPKAQTYEAAYTTLLIGSAWHNSPFRGRIVEVSAGM
ncbi:hypothetical protein N9D51_01385 [Actinomycetota bacterium]|nr:hypothetical protein [Actinomycetota bacterium]